MITYCKKTKKNCFVSDLCMRSRITPMSWYVYLAQYVQPRCGSEAHGRYGVVRATLSVTNCTCLPVCGVRK